MPSFNHRDLLPLVVAAILSMIPSGAKAQTSQSIELSDSQTYVDVMKGQKLTMPKFTALTPKKGFVRGWVKDWKGNPLKGASIGVRSTAVGGFYSGAATKTDARGYYELSVPWGAAHFYGAGYGIDYGDGRAGIALHPADGDKDSFASANGHVENWVLLPYGITSREEFSEYPTHTATYYGGGINVDFYVADPRPIFADEYSLPVGSQVELTLTPEGPLYGSVPGKTIRVVRNVTETGQRAFNVLNIPIGQYKLKARVLQDGNAADLKITETGPYSSRPFGLEPKEGRGQTVLSFRPGSAKAEGITPQRGSWDTIQITLKK